MASWIIHLMIADLILPLFPELDRRGYCVGNIAPDCNVENDDWTIFTPSREITHWMRLDKKSFADCERFYTEYILPRRANIHSQEEYSFLLGYYSHLIADAAFQEMIRDEKRIHTAWKRICAVSHLRPRIKGMPETWDSIKELFPKSTRMREVYAVEDEYLRQHPESGYITEILPLKEFPDYIDYMPSGCIVRKIGIMGRIPSPNIQSIPMITISKKELLNYVESTVCLISDMLTEKGVIL